MSAGPVLVVGATGALGQKVVLALLHRGKKVRALVRPSTDATSLEAKGVEIARGDMLDMASLEKAMSGVDAVITSAAGYTKRKKGDSAATDIEGNRNLAAAAARTRVRRFVLTSILRCDETPDVPHFWHKKLAEDALEERGVPFVALRPGRSSTSPSMRSRAWCEGAACSRRGAPTRGGPMSTPPTLPTTSPRRWTPRCGTASASISAGTAR